MRKTKTLKRKIEHIDICLTRKVDALNISTGFEDIMFLHKALPELDMDEISTEVIFLKHRFKAPLLVDAISGGPKKAFKINSSIAEAVEELGLGMVVGSQRVALGDEKAAKTFKVVREIASSSFIVANIGVQQITGREGLNVAVRCVEMIEADALSIHLNPLQEALQPEGDKSFRGCLKAISKVVDSISVPVIVKETGSGIDYETAKKLEEAGVAAINVAGSGGTSWAAVEYYRNLRSKEDVLSEVAKVFWDWGIPTAFSIYMVSKAVKIPIISSGGIRSGLDVAKSLAFGASMAAAAKPILVKAIRGSKEVKKLLNKIILELRLAMLLTGSKSIEDLKVTKYVVSGRLKDLIDSWNKVV